MGRPPLNVKPTMVRLTEDVRQRIIALVGSNRMAAFIRQATESELRRQERASRKPSQNYLGKTHGSGRNQPADPTLPDE